VTGARRLSQAISEGDGISIIALVADPDTARSAEEQGAEGLAVRASAPNLREATGLPILFRVDASPEAASDAGADACLIVVDVHDEESLADSLERIDPEIFLLSPREAEDDETHVERILDLLPDVPAGKLAIADLPATTRQEVLALERAGIDAVLVGSADVAHLVGGVPPPV
jgi:indole-3-glycerol phosphate synthase